MSSGELKFQGFLYPLVHDGSGKTLVQGLQNAFTEFAKRRIRKVDLLGDIYSSRSISYDKYQIARSKTREGQWPAIAKLRFSTDTDIDSRASSVIQSGTVNGKAVELVLRAPLQMSNAKLIRFAESSVSEALYENVDRCSVVFKKAGKPASKVYVRSGHPNRLRVELAKQVIKRLAELDTKEWVPPSNIDVNSLVDEVVSAMSKGNSMRHEEGAAVAAAPIKELDEAMNDVNYKAYLRDSAKLTREYGNCVVAYSGGEMIAVGASCREVMEKIPTQYKNSSILIQEIPERVIKFRRPFRVRR